MSTIVLICLICPIVFVAGILGYSFYKERNIYNSDKESDYRLFFWLGIVLLVIGGICLIFAFTSDLTFLSTLPLFIIGVIYTALGWARRDTWQKHD